MRRQGQFLTIILAVGLFAAAAVTGTGGWPVLVITGLLAIALVDSACRSIDRVSTQRSRGTFAMTAEPTVEVLRPATQSDQSAAA